MQSFFQDPVWPLHNQRGNAQCNQYWQDWVSSLNSTNEVASVAHYVLALQESTTFLHVSKNFCKKFQFQSSSRNLTISCWAPREETLKFGKQLEIIFASSLQILAVIPSELGINNLNMCAKYHADSLFFNYTNNGLLLLQHRIINIPRNSLYLSIQIEFIVICANTVRYKYNVNIACNGITAIDSDSSQRHKLHIN